MTSTVAILLVLAMAVTPSLAIGNSSVLNATCAALKFQPYDYCVDVLSADPAAASATDARGIATAAMNMTAHKAASTLQVITYLINELNSCRKIYSDMGETLASVLADFQAGRFDSAALEKAQEAYGGPDSCDVELFEGNSHKDPISQENDDNHNLALLASDILESIVMKKLQRGLNG
jgi:pectinesterase inhibitor-like protein